MTITELYIHSLLHRNIKYFGINSAYMYTAQADPRRGPRGESPLSVSDFVVATLMSFKSTNEN